MDPKALSDAWRTKAAELRELALESEARAFERCAEDLDEAISDWELEALTLHQAAEESGYSYSQLQRLVADGSIKNVGEDGAPRVRRGDLPRKPGRASHLRLEPGDLADEILARKGG